VLVRPAIPIECEPEWLPVGCEAQNDPLILVQLNAQLTRPTSGEQQLEAQLMGGRRSDVTGTGWHERRVRNF
jgi:hypothetical protein